MKKPGKPTDKAKHAGRKPVTQVVHAIMEHARTSRADGPSSGLFGRDAQMSSALTRAGKVLAGMDKATPHKNGSVLRNVIGSLTTAAPKKERRSWFFGSAKSSPMPDANRIEQLLKAAAKDGHRLVLDLDQKTASASANNEIECRLPPGAVDPVCEPR
jgi:hypothetical protein